MPCAVRRARSCAPSCAPGNATTGYRWRTSEVTGKSLEAVTRRPTYVADQRRPGTTGSGGTFVFQFKAIQAGTSVVKLVYDRSASAYSRPAKTFSVTIKVEGK